MSKGVNKNGDHAYSDEEKAEIIAHVLVNVASGRPVTRIFGEDEKTDSGFTLPVERTFWKWLFADPSDEIGQKLARAREFGVEALLDKAIAIAETPMIGESHTIERIKPADMDVNDMMDNGPQDLVKTTVGDMTAHRKLFIETMFKAAQMLKPKTYGPKLDMTSGGEKIDMLTAVTRGRQRAIDMQKQDQQGEDE